MLCKDRDVLAITMRDLLPEYRAFRIRPLSQEDSVIFSSPMMDRLGTGQ